MKQSILVAALSTTLLISCGGGGGGGSGGVGMTAPSQPLGAPTAEAPVKKKCTWVIYGDSVAAGQSTKGALTFSPAARIRQLRPDWEVIDRSQSGDSATLGVPRILNDPRPAGANVVGSWGLNDMSFDWDVKAPLAKFVDFMKAEGRKVVITGLISVGTKHAKYNEDELSVAVDHGAAFASWGETPVVTVDGVHPDQATTDAITEDLVNTMDKECS